MNLDWWQWIIVLIVAIFIVVVVSIVVYLFRTRVKRGSTKAQATSATAPASPAKPKKEYWSWKYFWTIVLALGAAGVFYYTLYTPGMRFVDVGDWAWDNWVWVLVFCGLILAIIQINAKALGGAAKTLRRLLFFAMFVMFAGIPAGFWVRDTLLPKITCPDVSAHETRSCTVNTGWSSWIKFAEGPENDGMQICLTRGVEWERTDIRGTTFWRFKAKEGRIDVSYRLYPPERSCPAFLPK